MSIHTTLIRAWEARWRASQVFWYECSLDRRCDALGLLVSLDRYRWMEMLTAGGGPEGGAGCSTASFR